MSKYKICVQETVVLRHEITIETYKDIDSVDTILNTIESESESLSDVTSLLDKYGCEVVEVCEDGSGNVEIVIDDLFGIE